MIKKRDEDAFFYVKESTRNINKGKINEINKLKNIPNKNIRWVRKK